MMAAAKPSCPSPSSMLNADPSLAHLSPLLSPASFVVGGYICLGFPISTDAFIQHFLKNKFQYTWLTAFGAFRKPT